MSQLKKGVLLSYVTIILTNVIGLALTPFIIRSLGDAEYGLYALIGAFVGYISVLDLGLNNTIVRYVAKFRAEKDKNGEESFLSTTMIIYGFISLIIGVIGTILYYNLESLFGSSLTSVELSKAKLMFLILIFNIAITLPGGAFTAICNGYEHFVFPRTINIARYLVRSAAVVGLLYLGGDAIGLVLLDTALNLAVIVINIWYVVTKLKIKFSLSGFQFPLIKEIFSYSIWIFVMALVYQFQWKGGQVILGIETNTVTVAIYAVGILLGTYYGAFASAINGVFLPKAMQMVVKNASGKTLTAETIRIGRITLIVLLGILGAFSLYGKQFITLWVGANYLDAWPIALLIMLVSTNILVQSFADSTLKAKKLFRFKGLSYIILLVGGTILGYFLIKPLNSFGIILGIATSWALSQLLVTFYFKKKMDFQIKDFYSELFKGILPVFIISIGIGFLIDYLIQFKNWIGFFIKVILFLTVYILLILRFAINNYEKNLFYGLISKKEKIINGT
ncbi:Membrane protein involved in the export of O-antigen and teichoic acid [Salegentibacter echinorum]|uniref:Membrane protein involved in the export of O-antigen and teichoic acid n=1 Tax=Salegentibacter echinorum TaxID=1073325 RepID=A0A1M5BUT8_SALEC|nr:oligosaccharide flippase family protein [Salegentibacter echinorum]SHF46215.1 Membrane protein involved in the export of O-antigen and teichoic acid [Salegentibacter echinorum]